MDYKLKIIILLFTLTCHQSDAFEEENERILAELMDELKPLVQTMVQKNTLEYHESCRYSEEQKRTKLSKDLLNLVTDSTKIHLHEFDFQGYKNKLIGITTSLSELNGPLCNSYLHLQCTSSGTCDCAEADESLGFKIKFMREDNRCVLTGGSLCIPDDIMELVRQVNPILSTAPKQDISCGKSSECIVKTDRSKCSLSRFQEVVMELKDNNMEEFSRDSTAFVFKKTKEGICVCKGTTATVYNSTVDFYSILGY